MEAGEFKHFRPDVLGKKGPAHPFKKGGGEEGDRVLWIEGNGEEDKKKGKLLQTLY